MIRFDADLWGANKKSKEQTCRDMQDVIAIAALSTTKTMTMVLKGVFEFLSCPVFAFLLSKSMGSMALLVSIASCVLLKSLHIVRI